MSDKKHYAERDIENQKYYGVHVSAMTGERLHSKSDIAAELAHRDEVIDNLERDKLSLISLLEYHGVYVESISDEGIRSSTLCK